MMTPQPIYGYAEYSTGESADGAYVEVTSSLGTVDTYVGPAGGWGSGYWQVDVGDPGPNWPDGTSFTVTITNDSGWESDPVNGVVTTPSNNMGTIILHPPTLEATASATPTTVELGNSVDFTGSATGGTEPYSWNWDFGDGNTSTNQNPTQTYGSTGTFTATLTVTDSASQSATDTITITVYEDTLSVTASANPTNVQVGNTVDFTGSASGGTTPYSWSWDFGDGSTSTQQNPTHSYSSTGTFTATLTVTDDLGSSDSDTVQITVYGNLNIQTDGPYEATVDENITLNATVNGGTSPYIFTWDLGNEDTKIGQDVSYAYSISEVYTITLTVEDDEGITESVETTATIYTNNLEVNIDVSDDPTEDDPIQFSGTASNGVEPYIWNWDFGDGSSEDTQNPTHTYDTFGNYTVTLNVTDDLGISNTSTITVYVMKKSSIQIDTGGPYNGVINYPVDFSGSALEGSSPFTWFWEFGDGTTSTDQEPSHIYSEPGEHTLSLTVTDSQNRIGNANTTVTISQNYRPAKPTVSGTFKGKEDRRYTYTISSTDPDGDDVYYYVDWGDGENTGWIGPYNSGEQVDVSHIWDHDGSYQLKVKAKDPYDAESNWWINEVIMPIIYENPFIHLLEQLANRFPIFEPILNIFLTIFD